MVRVILFLCFIFSVSNAQNLQNANLQFQLHSSNSQKFIENKGQWDDNVRYLAKTPGMKAWITDAGVVYDYYTIDNNAGSTPEGKRIRGHIINIEYSGINLNAADIPSGMQQTYYNYFIGQDESKWASEVRLYEDVIFENIYEGIDIRYYYDGTNLRYDYKAEAGADISQIAFTVDGSESITINERGELIIETSLGSIIHGKIIAYQDAWYGKKSVDCGFTINESGTVMPDIGDYDPSKELIIDPEVYIAMFNTIGADEAYDFMMTPNGSYYFAGKTLSDQFVTSSGAYDISHNGSYDAVMLRLQNDQIIYSTFLGGSQSDEAIGIDFSASGMITVAGKTISSDFPVSYSAWDQNYNGGMDIFLTEFNAAGTYLNHSTYLGGTSDDYLTSFEKFGASWILGGYTNSVNYPIWAAYDDSHNGGYDMFITEYKPSSSPPLKKSTYIGGDDDDYLYSIDVTGLSFSGSSESADFPVTADAYSSSNSGDKDAVYGKLDWFSQDLEYATYIGGSGNDEAAAHSETDDGVFITGTTTGGGFPTTPGAFRRSPSLQKMAFMLKSNSDFSGLSFSTYLGGSAGNTVKDLVLDDNGNPVITGSTYSNDFPTTPDAYQPNHTDTQEDVFVTAFNKFGSKLVYSTYLAGSNIDRASRLAVDDEHFYVLGNTKSADFPVTSTNHTYTGDYDFFIAKFPGKGISLDYPNGGEVWMIGSTQDITWSHFGVENIKIEWRTHRNLGMWMTLENSYPADSMHYEWTVPNTISNQCKFRVTDVDNPAVTDLSAEYFSLTDVGLSLLKPNGGEQLAVGSAYRIDWYTTLNGNVRIEYSTDGGANWTLITPSVPSIPSNYSWTVPNTPSGNCLVKIQEWGGSTSLADTSDAVFTIFEPEIEVQTPNGGERFKVGTVETVAWNAIGIEHISLQYTTNDGASWRNIVSAFPADSGFYDWTVPNYPTNQCKVKAFDSFNAFLSDESDDYFTIYASSVSLTAPNGGENWKVGETQRISWSNSNVDQLTIHYSTNNGTDWITVAAGAPDADGGFEWTIPAAPSTECLVRISDYSDTTVADISDGVFTIEEPSFVDDFNNGGIPDEYNLYQNFPNPFNPSSKIYFDLPEAADVSLAVYDITGRKTATLINGYMPGGRHYAEFNGKDLASGIYFYRIETAEYSFIRKMLLLK